MARIFITGSADGLGQMAAKQLIGEGHQVVLHARNRERGEQALAAAPAAEKVLIADLSDMDATKQLAGEVNALGNFDAIIHNAGVYQSSRKLILAVNSLAPYLLTCLIQPPKRLVYLSSGMHLQGNPGLQHLFAEKGVGYADSKLHVLLLSMAVARKWGGVYANAVDPGWVPTKMGGASAPDNLQEGIETQTWLAVSQDEKARVSGHYFYHQEKAAHLPIADDVVIQDKFLQLCHDITGVSFPAYPG